MKTLIINNDTFIWRNKQNGIVYNSANFKSFLFDNSGLVKSVCDQMDKLECLYTIDLDKSYENDKYFVNWIDRLLNIEAARIIQVDRQEQKMVSFKPILKIHNDISAIKANESYHDIVECLSEITIHLSGSSISKERQHYYKQILYTVDTEDILDYNKLLPFLNYIPPKNNLIINLIGDVFNYCMIKELLSFLAQRSSITNVYLTEELFNPNKITNIISEYIVNLHIICSAKNYVNLKSSIPSDQVSLCKFILLIEDLLDVNAYDEIRHIEDIEDVRPIFSSDMKEFFEENIYLNELDVENIKLTKREIFANQTINTNFFGKIEILPDGSIWDNVNFDQIGYIDNDFWQIMKTIFTEDRAWFYCRKQSPCSYCLYQWLCPPPSNYELIIKQTNLCTLDQTILCKTHNIIHNDRIKT